jgi:hypothetical protein
MSSRRLGNIAGGVSKGFASGVNAGGNIQQGARAQSTFDDQRKFLDDLYGKILKERDAYLQDQPARTSGSVFQQPEEPTPDFTGAAAQAAGASGQPLAGPDPMAGAMQPGATPYITGMAKPRRLMPLAMPDFPME